MHFFGHKEFSLPATPAGCTLAELLNFVSDDGIMCESRKAKQEMFMAKFIESFKGFQSGKGLYTARHEDYGLMDLEALDKSYFIHLGLAHSAPDTLIYEEVTLLGLPIYTVPHGTIDLLALTQDARSARAIAIYCCADSQAVGGKF